MRKIGFWVGLVVVVGVLAGCQPQEVKFQIKDQRVPEQAGLKVEWIRDFAREGILATQPSNFGRYYREKGELNLRLFRITNTSNEKREIYLSIPSEAGSAEISLSQYYFAPFKGMTNCGSIYPSTPVNPPFSFFISAYDSKFDYEGSFLEFDGGGREEVRTSVDSAFSHPIQIRPGESARVHVRVRLQPHFTVIQPRVAGIDREVGERFIPPGTTFEGGCEDFRGELFVGADLISKVDFSLFARSPVTDELNPIYVPAEQMPNIIASKTSWNEPRLRFPNPEVGRRTNGLAEQF
jgi:hypothetical protein